MQFKLQATTINSNDNEEIYSYVGDDGSTVKFQAGKEAFSYLFYKSSTASKKMQSKLVEAFIAQGFKQHSYAGGFREAIATLTV